MSEPPRRLLILLMGESLRSTATGIAVGARRASPRQSESQALGPAPAPAPARAHPDLHRRSQQRGAAGAGEATRAFPAQTEPRPQRRTRRVCAGDSSQESERPVVVVARLPLGSFELNRDRYRSSKEIFVVPLGAFFCGRDKAFTLGQAEERRSAVNQTQHKIDRRSR
jgi:hypothetical protein